MLAWLLHRAPNVGPIHGTTAVAHHEENVAAASGRLTANLIARPKALVNRRTVTGPRYPPDTPLEIDTEDFSD